MGNSKKKAELLSLILFLQMARERVSQMDTVWMMMEKLTWTHMKTPHRYENLSSIGLDPCRKHIYRG